MSNETIKELTEFINSYKKDCLTRRVLLGKSANILKLINNALERQKKEITNKVEEWWNEITHARLGYKDKYFTLDKEDIKRLIKLFRD